ncbi:MAG: hypothetical protein K2K84_05230 [Muribaculaceae bacterium]|nr:hypothetical protein [Muribaculaceae bacterium]
MSRRSLIFCVLSVLLTVYLVVMVGATNRSERTDTFTDIRITVTDTAGTDFINAAEVDEALGHLARKADTLKRANLNTLELRNRLLTLDRVEDATVTVMNNGVLDIRVSPLVPVARVFDPSGSYYINTTGKRVRARAAYHIDVPVITAEVKADSLFVASLLPLLRRIKTDPQLDAFVSGINVDRTGDIIVVPTVIGHVINFGDSTNLDDKIIRLRTFYAEVMPVKGWNAYDTVSVKWAGRVTATRAPGRESIRRPDASEEMFEETSADEEMLAGEAVTAPLPPKNT